MKTKEEANANLAASVAYIPERYKTAVARADWATPAASDAAEANYAAGVSNAVAKKTRQMKVKQVSNADWQRAAVEKGGAVIGERIRGSLEKQAAKWNPIFDAVSAEVRRLRPRSTDWRSNITNRVVPTVESWKKHSGKL